MGNGTGPVPAAVVELPAQGAFDGWKQGLDARLRHLVFPTWPDRIPPAKVAREADGVVQLETEPGIEVPLRRAARPAAAPRADRVLLVISGRDGETSEQVLARVPGLGSSGDSVVLLEPRGIGGTRWTRKHPPNYVARAHMLIGQTPDSGRIHDLIAAVRWLNATDRMPVVVVGSGPAGVLAAYAAALEPEIAGVVAIDPPASLMDPDAPVVLNALRVLDVPETFGLIAPRTLTLRGGTDALRARVRVLYERAEAPARLELR